MATMPRLYVPGPIRPGADLVLPPDRSHYTARVLRLRAGSEVVLFDGSGHEYAATITCTGRDRVSLNVGEARERSIESPLEIHLLQGISRGDRMDVVVQKATELGVQRITPVITEFSVVRLAGEKAEKRAEHWTRVAQSACEQCGRNRVPVVDAPQPFASRLQDGAAPDSVRIVLHPGAERAPLAPRRPSRCVELLIGPEGGLSGGELQQAVDAGFSPRSLGPRILRTETAAIAAIAVLQSLAGDL